MLPDYVFGFFGIGIFGFGIGIFGFGIRDSGFTPGVTE
jgi:hypothetical protein